MTNRVLAPPSRGEQARPPAPHEQRAFFLELVWATPCPRNTARAMSRDAVEIGERHIRAWEDGIDAGFRDLERVAAPDVEWVEDPAWPDARSCRGLAEIRELLTERSEAFEFEQKFERALAAGADQAVMLMRWRGRGAASGAETEMPFAVLMTTLEGRVIRLEFFLDRQRALEAAGIRE